MSVVPSPNVVSYADFLARRERRRRIEAELSRRDPSPIVDDNAAIAAAKPLDSRELACSVVGVAFSVTEA
jgi:hypothetical protein